MFVIPDVGDENWGQNVTNYLVAIPSGALQKTGGAFTLTADVNFGATFGLVSTYYKSRASNVASAGAFRLANTDLLEWRNFANAGNNTLGVNSSDQLTYNGVPLEINTLTSAHIFVGNVSNTATDVAMTGDIGISNTGATDIQAGVIVNADVNASAAITYGKLNLTGGIVNADVNASAAIVYSKLNLVGSIINSDIYSGAAIAYTKLALSNSIVNADINTSAAIAYAKLSLSASIVNADINSAAAIAVSKLAHGTVSQALRINNSGVPTYLFNAVNVRDYGATGDGITDDTTAIQNAINAADDGQTFFPAGTYKISSSLQLVYGSSLLGVKPGFSGGVCTTITQSNAAVPVFLFANSNQNPGSAEGQSIGVVGFHLTGGTDTFYAQNGGVGVTLKDIKCDGYSAKAIHLRGFIQNWILDTVECDSSTTGYGLYAAENGVHTNGSTAGTTFLFDKNAFYNLYTDGGINGVHIDALTQAGSLNTFTNVTVQATRQDGIVLSGFLRQTTFTGLSTETIGLSGPTPADSTATTVAASASVTVASGASFVNGQTVTIQGAGTNGADWYPVISSGGGTTTLVMTTTAPTAVTTQPITNRLYAEVVFGIGTGSGNTPACTTFSGYVGSSNGRNRYSVDLGNTLGGTTFINCLLSVPIYDPSAQAIILGQSNTQVIQAQNYKGVTLFGPALLSGVANYANATYIGTPLGRDLCLGLVDSNGNGTGTFGSLTLRKSAVNASTAAAEVFNVNSSGSITSSGLTASTALIANASKVITSSAVTSTELGYVSGVTSALQTQINAKGAGTVTSVSGTSNQIGSTGGATPVLSLASPLTTPGAVTVTGNLTFTPTTAGIVGTTTNNNAAAGLVGEEIRSNVGYGSVGTSGQYFDVTHIDLTAGDWDLEGGVIYGRNSAVITTPDIETGISTTTGNSATGLVDAVNWWYLENGITTFLYQPIPIPRFRVSIAAPTTYYLKGFVSAYSAATPQVAGFISARRVR